MRDTVVSGDELDDLIHDDEKDDEKDFGYGGEGNSEEDELAEAMRKWRALEDGAEQARLLAEEQDRSFQRDYDEAMKLTPDYVPPKVDSPIEEVAVKAAEDYEWFVQQLERDIERQRARFRADTQPGYDALGDLIVPEPEFDPSGLSRGEFAAFTRAVEMGYSPAEWQAHQRVNG